MDVDEASKKRKRVDNVGSADVETDGSANGPAKTTSAVPTKKAIDINALKAKMAAAKQKIAEIKASAPLAQEPSKPQVLLPSASLALGGVQKTAPTSSVNFRYQQEQESKKYREQQKAARAEQSQAAPLEVDPHFKRGLNERKARPMVFLEAGALTKKAEEQNQLIQRMVEAKEPVVDLNPPRRPKPNANATPEVEWWDEPFLTAAGEASKATSEAGSSAMDVDSLDRFDSARLREDLITLVIHHPVLSKPAAEAAPLPPQPLHLTPEQEKKLAKQKRRAELETRREEIILGIRPAEKGRVRLSNMMKVHGEAVSDPTEVQRRVLTEQAEREGRHHARNQERKLTPEQRKEKERAKLHEDTSLSSHVAVFRILSLANGKNRFKVDSEVRKNNLSGVAVYSQDFVVLAVEGGPDSITRFTKKMLKKVPWKQPLPPVIKKATPEPSDGSTPAAAAAGESAESKVFGKVIEPEDNECHLVWKGEVLRRAFTDFRFTFPTKGARAYFDELNVVHYYDSAKSYVAPLIAEPDS